MFKKKSLFKGRRAALLGEKHNHKMIHFPFPSNMCFSKLIPLCLLLLLSLLLQAAIGADPLFHFCFILENYTSNDPFSSNLNELTTLLSSKVPPIGFGFASTGQGQDNVYGLALYQGDVSSTNCNDPLRTMHRLSSLDPKEPSRL